MENKKVVLLLVVIFVSFATANYYYDFFNDAILPEKKEIFRNQTGETGEQYYNRMENYIARGEYPFPTEKVREIKLYRNLPLISLLSNTALDSEESERLLTLMNNPQNLGWGETTWNKYTDSEYLFKFFDERNNLIIKMWVCLDGCGMTHVEPYSPRVRSGELSEKGQAEMNKLINDILD